MRKLIDWLAYLYWQEKIISIRGKRKRPFYRTLVMCSYALRHVLGDMVAIGRIIGKSRSYRKRRLYFASSANQKQALLSLLSEEDAFMGVHCDAKLRYPLGVANLLGLFFIPVVILYGLGASHTKKRAAYANLDHYCTAIPHYAIALVILKLLRPNVLVMANDHNISNRAFLRAAKVLGITSVYLQHAAVTDSFPPLEFEVAVLDGKNSYDSYQKCGPVSSLCLICGALRNSPASTESRKTDTVGICTNSLDDLDPWREIVQHVLQAGYKVRLRCHPTDNRKSEWMLLSDHENFSFSNARRERLVEYLSGTFAVVGSESNVLLDSVCAGVPAICYKTSEAFKDWYGFVKNGVCPVVDNPSALFKQLDMAAQLSHSSIRARASYYIHDSGFEYDELVNIIHQLLTPSREIENLLNRYFDRVSAEPQLYVLRNRMSFGNQPATNFHAEN